MSATQHTPEASIVIPCYNHGSYLPQALEKARAQEEKTIEIIVVNDGSTDEETLSILEKLESRKEKGLSILHLPHNKGLPAARNYGIAHATAPFVLCWDCDDHFEPSFLRKACPLLEADASLGAVGCYVRIHEWQHTRERLWRPRGGDITAFLFRTECVGTALLRKKAWEAIGGYDEAMIHGMEDWDFWLSLTQAPWHVKILKEPLFHYIIRADSMARTTTKTHEKELLDDIYHKHAAVYAKHAKQALWQNTWRMLFNPGYIAYPTPMIHVLHRNMRGHSFYRIYIPCMELLRHALYPMVWARDGLKYVLKKVRGLV